MFTRKAFTRALTLATVLSLLLSSVAFADVIYNNVDATVDATAESLALTVGSSATVDFAVQPLGDDGKPGCNLTGQTTLVTAVNSSDANKVGVNPTSLTFDSCGAVKSITVSAIAQTTSAVTVSLSETSNGTDGTFDLNPATFTVTVGPSTADPCLSVANPAAPYFATDGSEEDGLNGWFVTIPTVSASSSTANATISYSIDDGETFSATAPILGQGTTTVIARATSATCNKTADTSTTFKVDTIAPGVNPADVNISTWTNTPPVTQNFTSNDGTGSGLANAADASFTLSVSADSVKNPDGTFTATSDSRTVADVAGNTTTRTLSARIDTVAPVISGSNVVNSTWRNTDLAASFTASDALSGLANSADASFTLTASDNSTLDGDGNPVPTVVSKIVYDIAGNSSTRSVSALIDKVAPSVLVTGVSNGVQYTLGSVPTAGCNTSDSLSGVATQATASTTGGPVGYVTVTCSGATDNAGNTGSASVRFQVIYNWSGFFRPVDNLPTLNVVKAGSAIPLKFSLGGDQGLGVLAAGSPTSKVSSCDTAGTPDTIEETVTAGSSSLSYDPATGQYNYVWKTDKGWAGTCRTLTMVLADGTIHQALFKLTK